MEKFGATGYSPDLHSRMRDIWKRRHRIVHSAQPETDITSIGELQELREFINASKIVDEFIETTDRFVVKSCPDAAQ